MSEQRQSATYFTFKGGLNYESSDLNAPPESARVLDNVEITSAGTVKRRKGLGFLPRQATATAARRIDVTQPYTKDSVKQLPASNGTLFRVVNSDTLDVFEVYVMVCAGVIYLYDVNQMSSISLLTNYRQAWDLGTAFGSFNQPQYPAMYADKVSFAQQGTRLFITGPSFPLVFLYYDSSQDTFKIQSEIVSKRDITNSTTPDARVKHNGNVYACIKKHFGSAANYEPGVGLGWRDAWVLEGEAPATGAPAAWALDAVGGKIGYIQSSTYATTGIHGTSFYAIRHWFACATTTASLPAAGVPFTGASWDTYWDYLYTEVTSVISGSELVYGRLRGQTYSPGVVITAGGAYNKAAEYHSNVYPAAFPATADFKSFPEYYGFSSVLSAGGRMWYASTHGKTDTLFCSQSLSDEWMSSACFSAFDTRHAETPDILNTDGADIKFAGAAKLYAVHDYRAGVLVGGDAGVWALSGPDGYFVPNNYSLKQLTNEEFCGRFGGVAAETLLAFATVSGIYLASQDQISGEPSLQQVNQTIDSYWLDLIPSVKRRIHLGYSKKDHALYLGYDPSPPDVYGTENVGNVSTHFRDVLVLNLPTGAWSRRTFAEDPSGRALRFSSIHESSFQNQSPINVTASGGLVVDGAAAQVTVPAPAAAHESTLIILGMQRTESPDADYLYMLSPETDEFADFAAEASLKETNQAIIQTVPQVFNDIGHRKQAPYVHVTCDIVETGFDGATQTFTNPGSLLLRVLWDFYELGDAPGKAYEVYRPNLYRTITYSGKQIPRTSTVAKQRVRGMGRAFTLRFESADDKDFHLLGWQTDMFASRGS